MGARIGDSPLGAGLLRLGWAVLPPLLALALWQVSGRENLTKSQKTVEVSVVDSFGDPAIETQFRPGPIFGYYVGLDAVGYVTLATAALAAFQLGWMLWRRKRLLRRQT